jgi:membrane fusion protein (multidrug efflux system)
LPGRRYTAQIQAIDPLIDANGRSVGIRGCIDNRQLQLRPGMFARANTVFNVREDARVIPEEAIVPQGNRQFVIKLLAGPDAQTRTTKRVEVKVGMRSPGKVEITEGLEPGDTVVAAGQQRVQRDGTVVQVVQVAAAAPAPGAGAARPAASSAPIVAAQPGANPCGAVVAEAPARSGAAPGQAAPERKASPAATRDPA